MRTRTETMKCLGCGKSFSIYPYEKGKRKYCSYPCYRKYSPNQKSPPIFKPNKTAIKNCQWCDKPFAYDPRRTNHKFCSSKCQKEYNHHSEFNSKKEWEKSKIKTCPICGKTFKSIRGNKQKYCSKACSGLAYMSRQRVNRTICKKLIEEKGKCEVCGFKEVLVSHHIISPLDGKGGFNEYANNPSNIVVLCPNHHALTHKGYISLKRCKDGSLEVTNL